MIPADVLFWAELVPAIPERTRAVRVLRPFISLSSSIQLPLSWYSSRAGCSSGLLSLDVSFCVSSLACIGTDPLFSSSSDDVSCFIASVAEVMTASVLYAFFCGASELMAVSDKSSFSTTETSVSVTGSTTSATVLTVVSDEWWLRKSPKARTAAADSPIAARLKKTTTFLRRAMASSSDEIPSQMWAGTSSCPFSRMDLI